MTYPPRGTYGLDATHGDARPPGPHATLRSSDGSQRAHVPPSALLSISIEPEHTAAWDCEIEAAPVLDEREFSGGEFDLYGDDGSVAFRGDIDTADAADDGTLTIGGVGRVDRTLTDEEIDVSFRDVRGDKAIEQVFNQHTGFLGTVHDPPPRPVEGETLLSADQNTIADFRRVFEFYERDEAGRFTGGASGAQADPSAPPKEGEVSATVAPSDPVALTDQGIKLQQINHLLDCTDTDTIADNEGLTREFDTHAAFGEVMRADVDGDNLTLAFEVGYTIPRDTLQARLRAEVAPAITRGMELTLTRGREHENYKVGITGDATSGFEWFEFPAFSVELTPGTWYLTINQNAAGDSGDGYPIDYDLLSAYDNRYGNELTFPTGPIDGAPDRPGLYPEQHTLASRVEATGMEVESVSLSVTIAAAAPDRGPPAEVGILAPASGEVLWFDEFDGSIGIAMSVDAFTPRVQTRVRLRPSDDPDVTFPAVKNASRTLTSFELEVDGNAVPAIEEYSEQGTPIEVLQGLADRTGYYFALEHGLDTDIDVASNQGLRAEAFRRGDPDVARELPDGVAPLDYSRDTETAGYANRVTVIGGERQFGPGRYEATAEDTDEIAQRGVEAIEIERDDLNTHNDVYNRARVELEDRLSADEQGMTIDATPAIVEPGYPYQIPVGARDDVLVAWGDNEWGAGAWGGAAQRSLETSSFAAGESTSLDLAQEGGLGRVGFDQAGILRLLAGD